MRTSLLLVSAVVCACSSASIERDRPDNLSPDGGEHATGGDSSSGGNAGGGGSAGGHAVGGEGGHSTGGAPPGDGGSIGVCSIACGNTAELLYPYADTYEALRHSTLRVCANDHCADGAFASLASDPPPAEGGTGALVAPGVEVVVWNRGGAFVLEADFRVDDPRTLAAGDLYSLTVTSDLGRSLVVQRKAHYETYANCAGTCTRAAFDRTHPECCPRDEAGPAPELFLGGPTTNGCNQTFDFWCTKNFRVETSPEGCESWNYENDPTCTPPGSPDGG